MRKLLVVFLVVFFLILSRNTTFSATDFETSISSEYKIADSGDTEVTNTISIKNKSAERYPTSFVMTLSAHNPQNIRAYEAGNLLDIVSEEKDLKTILKINFNEKSLGKDVVKTFVISFKEPKLTQKSGEIWEVTIPKVENVDDFYDYKINLSVPYSFGEEAFLSPEASDVKQQNDRFLYVFAKDKLAKSGITGGFGKFQVFDFKLKYHLENDTKSIKTEKIAIPPDTSTQRLFYKSIKPQPESVISDNDGNWIAEFKLTPGQKETAEVSGQAQIFATPRSNFQVFESQIDSNKKPSSYWNSDDTEILEIAKTLNSPQEIYEYVINALSYDFSKIGQKYDRLGGKSVLQNPTAAICMEFTDLFISIARAKGIAAREINGYAYSQNPTLEPLSLVSDVLHSWPEYWDNERKTWIPIDPTWADTTGGVDFFNKFDLRHFAFVVHGENPVLPYAPGFYKIGSDPQKDVDVAFGFLPDKKNPEVKLNYRLGERFSLFTETLMVSVENGGPSALYDETLIFEIDGVVEKKEHLNVLLPYGSMTFPVTIDYGFLGFNTPVDVKAKTSNTELVLGARKNKIIINQLIAISVSAILLFLVYYLLTKLSFSLFLNKRK